MPGLGTTGGFKLYLEDRASLGYEALDQATKAFLAKAYQTPELAGLFSTYQVNVPQLYADLDRTKARQLGVPVTEVFDTMQIYLGSLYVNDFNKFGRTYSVRVQADAPYRARAEDIGMLKVRSNTGEMVPLSALMNVRPAAGPERALRYNGFLAADINGRNAPGFSSGQAQDAIERIAAETLPPGIGYEWTEITYQEILAGNSAIWVYPLAIFLVFLVLAALYESLALPIAIILIVPLCLGAALTGVWLTNGDNNIFTQIGFMVLVGLAAKNAILIVEFARELEFAGQHAGAGGDRGEPPAAAADHHDLDRLHHGRGAARLLGRRRRRDAPGDGHRGVRRHDRRHRLRHLPHAGVLRAAARPDGQPAAQAPRRDSAPRRGFRRRGIAEARSHEGRRVMAWVLLTLAGLLEVVWATGLKYTEGFTRLLPSVITIAAMIASIYLLGLAVRTIPIGTGYAVWTGIGAVGVAILGMVLFNEPRTVLRIGSILLIVAGIVGLKLVTQ